MNKDRFHKNSNSNTNKYSNIIHRKQGTSASPGGSQDYTKLMLSSLGNQAIQQMMTGAFIQTKSNNMNGSADLYEKQADQAAEEMVKGGSPSKPATKIDNLESGGSKGIKLNSESTSQLNELKGGGTPIDSSLRDYFEPRLGVDLGNVRVHKGSQANKLAKTVNARAFTKGNEIVFGAGQYQPGTKEGKKLIGHELVHTVQQAGKSSAGTVQAKELKDVGTEDRVKIQTVASNYTIGNSLIDIFNPGLSGYSVSSDVLDLINNRVDFSGVTDDLKKGLRWLAAIIINGNTLPVNHSITWTARFADEDFANCSYYSSLSDELKEIYNGYGIYRFTHYSESSESGSVARVLVESLGNRKGSSQLSATPDAEQIELNKNNFEANCTILSASEAGEGYENFSTAEKEILYNTVALLPAEIMAQVADLKWRRKQVNADTAGLYSLNDHAITLYDLAFKDNNTLLGDLENGLHSLTEQTILHEIGHAVDNTLLRNARDEYNATSNRIQELTQDYNAVVADKNRTIASLNEAVANFNDAIGTADETELNRLKQIYLGLKGEVESFDQQLAELDSQIEAQNSLLAIKETERLSATSPGGRKYILDNNTWDYGSSSTTSAFQKVAIDDGAIENSDKTVDGAITEYGETSWQEYHAEAFSLYFTDRERMRLTRPNLFAYFDSQYGGQ